MKLTNTIIFTSLVCSALALPSGRVTLNRRQEIPANNGSLGSEAKEMLCRVNAERAKQGRKPLQYDSRVAEAARKHSAMMHQKDKLQHEGFTPATSGFMNRVQLEGFKGGAGAENIASGMDTVEGAMKSWIQSSGHYSNILDDNKCFGFGRDGVFWTQVFASGDQCDGPENVDCSAFGL